MKQLKDVPMFRRACKILSLSLSVFAVLTWSVAAQATDRADLKITIKKVKNANGQIFICLFHKPDNFPTCTRGGNGARSYGAKAKKGSVSLSLQQLPVGTYAISAAHDQNNDGKIDKHFLFGYPTEGAGMSNYPEPLRGKPKFDVARFKVTKTTGTVEVIMHYP
ncbi:MAG: DUF2141 domain-containing protein [Alphaproteobacteria bacterium]|nr:DUF2141 domain-containing protein [Alphaproteobacteria bacterium]